jgi:hypothetical protein
MTPIKRLPHRTEDGQGLHGLRKSSTLRDVRVRVEVCVAAEMGGFHQRMTGDARLRARQRRNASRKQRPGPEVAPARVGRRLRRKAQRACVQSVQPMFFPGLAGLDVGNFVPYAWFTIHTFQRSSLSAHQPG